MIDHPSHLALIMDGNGRWAQARGKSRLLGHKKGAEVAQEIVECCIQKSGVKYLTLYAFSTENWSRPKEEIDFLFKLLDSHFDKKSKTLIENNIVLKTIGDLKPLPHSLQKRIESIKKDSFNNTGLVLTLGLNYGGRQEIIEAVNNFTSKNPGKTITDKDLSESLNTNSLPDPDLIIRTSGEMRLSNFMTWQSAYSELYFTKTLWPDFTYEELEIAFKNFSKRQRRFGSIKDLELSENFKTPKDLKRPSTSAETSKYVQS
jgi:undecaprenyl diphosphate synthase